VCQNKQIPLSEHDFYDHLLNDQLDEKLDIFKILEVHELLKEKPKSFLDRKLLGRRISFSGDDSHNRKHSNFEKAYQQDVI
jgi:hypothetical protein